jgi:signal peptidase I
MADESAPPGSEHVTPTPAAQPAPSDAITATPSDGRSATPSVAAAKNTTEWVKIEIIHLVASLVLGGAALGVAYLLGYDLRIGGVVGIVTVLFGRSVTHLFLPDHKPETAGKPGSASPPPTDTGREIVETIVFVVVLVLLLKSFVAEAFVIPTGSMATTLWGYQKVVNCPECDYQFPVNCSAEVDPQEGQEPAEVIGCTCPNCRYTFDFGKSKPAWNSGDRVLVAKFLYDLLQRQPERLDVVVFKYPGDTPAEWPQTGPYNHNHVPMNYIKRLVGLPGEVIAIHAGNLYRIPADQVPAEVRDTFKADAAATAYNGSTELWRRQWTHTLFNDTGSGRYFEKNKSLFQIVRKPPETMLAMRRIVFDNDHQPKDLPPERWEMKQNNGWTADGLGFRYTVFANAKSRVPPSNWLYYQHVLRDSGGKPQLITDFMGYNTPRYPPRYSNQSRQSGMNWVSDLMIECEATVSGPTGILTLELGRGVDRFEARFDLSNGVCKLVRITKDKELELASQPTVLNKAGKYLLRFADFDDRLTVWVNDTLPFGDGKEFDPPDDAGPVKENDLDHPAGIEADGVEVQLKHLQVWRDTYYTVGESSPGSADVGPINWADPDSWRKLSELPYRTLDIQPGHFLCMGDNSPESSDGRSWGLVPERLLLGRALMVYFPFNRAGRIR